MLNNLPQVTKNILILNIVFFLATFILKSQGIDIRNQIVIARYGAIFRGNIVLSLIIILII